MNKNKGEFYFFQVNEGKVTLHKATVLAINNNNQPFGKYKFQYVVDDEFDKVYVGTCKCETWDEVIYEHGKHDKLYYVALSPHHLNGAKLGNLVYKISTKKEHLDEIKEILTFGAKMMDIVDKYGIQSNGNGQFYCADENWEGCNPKDNRPMSWNVDITSKRLFFKPRQNSIKYVSNFDNIWNVFPSKNCLASILIFGNCKLVKWRDGIIEGKTPIFWDLNEPVRIHYSYNWSFTDFSLMTVREIYNELIYAVDHKIFNGTDWLD